MSASCTPNVQWETFSPRGSNRNKSKMSRGTGQLRLSSQRLELESSFIQDHGPHLGLHRLNTDGLKAVTTFKTSVAVGQFEQS